MKRIIVMLTALVVLASCDKEDAFRPSTFPGFTANGEKATWVVFRHNVLDQAYLISTLPTLAPPSTFNAFDSTLKAGYAKETSPFSIRLYKDGSIATVAMSGANQYAWVKQSSLKWEKSESDVLISGNNGGTWTTLATARADQDKLLIKFQRAYFGDNSADKGKAVLDIYYSLFN